MTPDLSYRNDNDRCYGATGMAIGVVVADGEQYLASITVDGPAHQMLQYTPDFYVQASRGASAQQAWNRLLTCYNLSMITALSNMLCRTLVLDSMPVAFEVKQMLHDILADEGRDTCSLDDDEIERLFNKNYDYLFRIFSHRGVQSVAHDLASALSQRRTMSRLEILDQLKALSMI